MFSQLQKTQLTLEQRQAAYKASLDALKRYHEAYNNTLYTEAIAGKTTQYANRLIDEALAICGDPFYTPSRARLGDKAQRWLGHFAQIAQYYPRLDKETGCWIVWRYGHGPEKENTSGYGPTHAREYFEDYEECRQRCRLYADAAMPTWAS
jgi:hypothetical protein